MRLNQRTRGDLVRVRRIIVTVGISVVTGLGLASPAVAESPSYVKTPPPEVVPVGFGQAGAVPVKAPLAHRADDSLALTGGDVLGLTAMGFGLVGGGGAVRRLGRRRHLPRSL